MSERRPQLRPPINRDQEQYDKNEEQNLSNRSGPRGDTKKSEDSGDYCYNEEDNGSCEI